MRLECWMKEGDWKGGRLEGCEIGMLEGGL